MIRTRHRLLAALAAVVAIAVAAQASASSLLVLSYSNAKTFGNVHIAGGAIDLTNGVMIVTTSSFGFVPSGGQNNERGTPNVAEYGVNAIHDALAEGGNYAGGFWNGTNGIFSSAAANDSDGLTTVGWVDNSLTQYTIFKGIPVTTNQSIIGYTWFADSLMQGIVTAANDSSILAGSLLSPGGAIGSVTGGSPEWIDAAYLQEANVTAAGESSILATALLAPQMHDLNFNPSAPIVPSSAAVAVPEPVSALLVLAAFSALYLSRMTRRRSA